MKKYIVVKRILIGCAVVAGLMLVKLGVSFALNEVFIQKYNRQQYDEELLGVVLGANFPEGYIAHYNLGGAYFMEGKYGEAEAQYRRALEGVPRDRECEVRTNLSLALLAQIQAMGDELTAALVEPAEVLLASNCANVDGASGRNKKSQDLYNQIVFTMVNGAEGGGDEESDDEQESDSDDGESEDGESTVNEQELEEHLRKQAEETADDRNNNFIYDDYEYYTGEIW